MTLTDQWAEDLLRALKTVEPVRASQPARTRVTRRGRALVLAFSVIVLLSAGVAYAVTEWGLPPAPPSGWENDPRYTGLPADQLAAEREAAVRAAEEATPLPAGADYRRPTSAELGQLDPTGAASVVLIRRGCAWKADLIEARKVGDEARMEEDVQVLLRPIWLRYHVSVQKAEVAAIERARYEGVVAGDPNAVAMLKQDYGINCDGSISPTLHGG